MFRYALTEVNLELEDGWDASLTEVLLRGRVAK